MNQGVFFEEDAAMKRLYLFLVLFGGAQTLLFGDLVLIDRVQKRFWVVFTEGQDIMALRCQILRTHSAPRACKSEWTKKYKKSDFEEILEGLVPTKKSLEALSFEIEEMTQAIEDQAVLDLDEINRDLSRLKRLQGISILRERLKTGINSDAVVERVDLEL